MNAFERLRPRTIDALGLAACGVLTAVGWFAIVAPIAKQREEVNALRSTVDAARASAMNVEQRQLQYQTELNDIRSELSTSPVRLESFERLNHRVAEILKVASQSGLQIHESRSGRLVRGPRFDRVPIELSGNGRYPDCAAFLHRVHEELPDVEVVGMDLTGNPAQPTVATAFHFDLSWYAVSSMAAAEP